MIKIIKTETVLLLEYRSDRFLDAGWVDRELEEHDSVLLRHTFTFRKSNLLDVPDENEILDDTRIFVLGKIDGSYYTIDRQILGLKHDLKIDTSTRLNQKSFIANRNISIFRKIDRLMDEPIVIGGEEPDAVPEEDFYALLREFPTSTELDHYSGSRVTRILKDYFKTMSDAQRRLGDYLEKKQTIKADSKIHLLAEYEPRKFEYVRDELQEMLVDAESYPEGDWQKAIVEFLLLLYPKYVAVLEDLHIKDFYSDPTKATNRYIDLALVDAGGSIDIVEIKKPFSDCILSRRRYRGNYTPRLELAGAVMQAEKYIFHLSKWGRDGEKSIQNKRKSELPPGLQLKITNPRAMLILGRDADFDDEQYFDFEIIRRKYANVIDVMTYDDILRRLDNIISMIGRNFATQ
jgi:hypothetical protein